MKMRFRGSARLPHTGKRTAQDGSQIEWNLESSPSYIRRFNAKGAEITYMTGSIPESELRLVLKTWGKPRQLRFL